MWPSPIVSGWLAGVLHQSWVWCISSSALSFENTPGHSWVWCICSLACICLPLPFSLWQCDTLCMFAFWSTVDCTPHHCNPVNLHFLCLSIVRHLAFSAHHHLSCVFQALQSTIVLSSSSSTSSSSSSPSMPLPGTAISDYFLQILQSHITWSKSESKKQIAFWSYSLFRNKLCSDSLFSQISKVLTGSTIWFPTLTMSPSRLQSRTNLKQNDILQI